MNTVSTQAAPQAKGCSTVVVFMLATLAFVVGLLAGAGGLMGYLKGTDDGAATLGIVDSSSGDASAPSECPECEECPPCEESSGGGESPGVYALVYPIEQTLRIEGKLDKEILREYVIKHRYKLQECYQEVLEKDPGVKGEVSLQFTLTSDGKVLAAVARQSTIESKALKACVLKEIKAWKLPKDKVKSSQAVVKFDVLFTPIGGSGP